MHVCLPSLDNQKWLSVSIGVNFTRPATLGECSSLYFDK